MDCPRLFLRAPKRAVHALLCIGLALAATVAACTDRLPTAPVDEGRPLPGPSDVKSNATTRPADAQDSWEVTVALPGAGMAINYNLGTIPYGSVYVQATGSGTITGTWAQPCTDPNSCTISPVPPTGVMHPNHCFGPMHLEGARLTGVCGGGTHAGFQYLQDSVIVGRKEGTLPTRYNPDGTLICSAPYWQRYLRKSFSTLRRRLVRVTRLGQRPKPSSTIGWLRLSLTKCIGMLSTSL